MQINQLSQASSTDTKTSASNTSNNDMFLKLLVAQLKNQSSLDPVDPNQFVAQLAQFNTLNEVIQIRQLLQKVPSATTKG